MTGKGSEKPTSQGPWAEGGLNAVGVQQGWDSSPLTQLQEAPSHLPPQSAKRRDEPPSPLAVAARAFCFYWFENIYLQSRSFGL